MAGRYALLIGNSNYDDPALCKLALPEADIDAVEAVLSSNLCGFAITAVMHNYSWHDVQPAISEFFYNRYREDFLLLYFSGHGMRSRRGNLYLTFSDTKTDNLEGTAIPDRFIAERMDDSRAEAQLLVLDCCHAAAFARGEAKSPIGGRMGIEDEFGAVINDTRGLGRYVLAATGAIQYAYEQGQVDGKASQSLFTQFFTKGLQSAEADRDHDACISIQDLSIYIRENVRAIEPTQEPELFARSNAPVGQLILSRLPISVSPVDSYLDMLPDPPRGGLCAINTLARSYALYYVELKLLGDPHLRWPLQVVLDYMAQNDQEETLRAHAASLLSHLPLDIEEETIKRHALEDVPAETQIEHELRHRDVDRPFSQEIVNMGLSMSGLKYRGKVWRHVPAGAQPLQVGYILRSAGRWNRCGLYGCLYTSLSPQGAVSEYRRYLQQAGMPHGMRKPRELVSIMAEVSPIIDLTDEALSPIPPQSYFLVGDSPEDLEMCRSLADHFRKNGYAGILVPSSARKGDRNLIIYVDGLQGSILLDEGPDRLPMNERELHQ